MIEGELDVLLGGERLQAKLLNGWRRMPSPKNVIIKTNVEF